MRIKGDSVCACMVPGKPLISDRGPMALFRSSEADFWISLQHRSHHSLEGSLFYIPTALQ